MEKKKCTKCGKLKDFDEFSWKHKNKKRHPNCKACCKKVIQKHYNENKDVYKARAVLHTAYKRKSHSRDVVKYLMEHPCVDCGEKDPIVLQFDHVRGSKKDNIAHMISGGYAWKTIKSEIDKCEVRCANCHTRKTAKQFGWKYKTEVQ